MPKLTISRAEHKALLASIKHWVLDVKVPLVVKGKERKIRRAYIFSLPYWEDTKVSLLVDSEDCSLCKLHGSDCSNCILSLFYGKSCTASGSSWNQFCIYPSLATCNAMIAAMVEIVRNVEVK